MEVCIRFLAAVDENTTGELLLHIDNLINNGVTKVHLLISSPGGSVYHGLSLYNYLVSLPIELYTYNFGSVDSIGVVLFCSGKRRFSVRHARFLLHPVKSNIRANSSMDEKAIDEMLKLLKIDQSNIAKIIASTIGGRRTTEIEEMIHNRTTLSPEEAKELGLVHEIQELQVPMAQGVISIFNPKTAPMPFFTPPDIPGGFTKIENSYSFPPNNYTRSHF